MFGQLPDETRLARADGTLDDGSDTDWTYINVRRLFNMAEKTIQDGTQFAVFEPNDQRLWEGLKRTVGALRQKAFQLGVSLGHQR